jgi:hypothetical protein
MKRLFCILIVGLITLEIFAQDFYIPERKPVISKPVKVIGTMIAWSVLNGIGDGLNDNGEKGWGHAINALSYATLLGGTIWSHPEKGEWPIYFIDAAAFRFALFNHSYNTIRGLPWNYIGTTETTDKLLKNVPAHFRNFVADIGICVSVGITIDRMKPYKARHYSRNTTFNR